MSKQQLTVTGIQGIAVKTESLLTLSKTKNERADNFGKNLLTLIQEKGMSVDFDQQLEGFIVKCKKTRDAINKERTEITGLFNVITKEFTSIEKNLTDGELVLLAKKMRNEFAKEQARLAAIAEAERIKKIEIDTEVANIKAHVDTEIYNGLLRLINNRIDEIQSKFMALSLDKFDAKLKGNLQRAKCTLDKGVYMAMAIPYPTLKHHDITHVDHAKGKALEVSFETSAADYEKHVKSAIETIIAQIPSRKAELEDFARIEKEDAAKAAKLREEAAARAAAEKEKREAEAKADREAKAASTKATAEGEIMNSLFTSPSISASTASIRKKLKIVVKGNQAYAPIFSLWMEHEGKNLPSDKIEKYTLARMMAWCAKHASDTGELIQSPFIDYEDEITAINRAS